MKRVPVPPGIPDVVVVSGRRIRLASEKAETNTACRGVYVGHKNLIVLDASCAPDELRAVVVHEIMHDVDQVCGVGLSEQSVASMASVLFQVIRDNPDLIAWLQERA